MSEAVSILDGEVASPQPGRQLAAARERCGLSIADVAQQLKLSPWQVEALEASDYRHLPGAVFVRGFIRNYARLVKLDAAALLVSAEPQLSPVRRQAEVPRSVDIPFPSGRELRWHKYAIAVLVLLVPVVIFEFYREDASEVTVKSRQTPLPQPRIMGPEKIDETGAARQAPAASDAAASTARAVAAMQPGETAAATPETSTRTARVERKSGEHLLKLKFDRESWVEIRDRNGHTIFSQLNPAGTEQAVSGLAPLSLVVGNAAGVRLTHNDQPVNLAPHTKVDVARLTLE